MAKIYPLQTKTCSLLSDTDKRSGSDCQWFASLRIVQLIDVSGCRLILNRRSSPVMWDDITIIYCKQNKTNSKANDLTKLKLNLFFVWFFFANAHTLKLMCSDFFKSHLIFWINVYAGLNWDRKPSVGRIFKWLALGLKQIIMQSLNTVNWRS